MPDPRPSPGPQGRRSKSPEPSAPQWRGWLPLALLVLSFVAWQYLGSGPHGGSSISYSDFYAQLAQDRVRSVKFQGLTVTGEFTAPVNIDGKDLPRFTTSLPLYEDATLMPLLREKHVRLEVEGDDQYLLVIINSVLPILLIVGIWIWMSRRAQNMMGPGGPLGGMLRGRTKRFDHEQQVPVRFDDVAGLKAAKQDLQEIVQFLKEPERFRRLGGNVPRGVLLVGPPGTGKTLLARAVAGEANVPFFSINGSEFIELFVGVGASRVRELFEEGKKNSPAIIFIDEIDAVGRSRGAGLGGGHDEREQTLNQLLSEMDGFSRSELVIVLAATNRPDVLDSALLRPGRFDRRVLIDRPEVTARQAILGVHTRNKPLSPEVDLATVAANTPGFSGAELENLANEAALNATRRGASAIEPQDFSEAYDKIVLGDPRETKLDPKEKHRVAVHEAGHAVVAHFSEGAEPLHRVTILPRGMALGVTQQTPGADRHVMTEVELTTRLRVLMGGRAGESVVFGNVSSGAENDLRRASELAFKMVAHFGMSERIGPVFHEHRTEHPFLGQMLATEGGTSDATVHIIEQETRDILHRADTAAKDLIGKYRVVFDRLVEALLARETIEKTELFELLGTPRDASGGGEPAALHFEAGEP